MVGLKRKLEAFHPESEKELDGIFLDLAESFLYGGYISVKDCENAERYRIYLRTVEFYCHYDGKDMNSALPKDPIVYHRNGKYVKGEVPYFPLMAFHAHASGYDITFENKELGLRASALIRAYEVYDVKREKGKFLTYSTKAKKFVDCQTEKERVNHQSTYLYNFLNGFMGDSVVWIDEIRSQTQAFKITPRKNVPQYKGEEKQLGTKDDRMWSFMRQEEISDADTKQ